MNVLADLANEGTPDVLVTVLVILAIIAVFLYIVRH